MKIAWMNDLHLEFLSADEEAKFMRDTGNYDVEAYLIAGDIAQAPTIKFYLSRLSLLPKPIYFVLGNHDFYKGSITGTRQAVRTLLPVTSTLHWLNESGVVKLTDKTALVGHDGWADGRYGYYDASSVELNDFHLIRELKTYSKVERLHKMQTLAHEAAEHFAEVLPKADWAEQIVVVTHVPPFDTAAWYQGKPSDAYYLPFFSCKVVGEVLQTYMQEHPNKKMLVLCGHTHGGGTAQILPNLLCLTGEAEYGDPRVQGVLDL